MLALICPLTNARASQLRFAAGAQAAMRFDPDWSDRGRTRGSASANSHTPERMASLRAHEDGDIEPSNGICKDALWPCPSRAYPRPTTATDVIDYDASGHRRVSPRRLCVVSFALLPGWRSPNVLRMRCVISKTDAGDQFLIAEIPTTVVLGWPGTDRLPRSRLAEMPDVGHVRIVLF